MPKDYAKRFDRAESKPKSHRLLKVIAVIVVVLILILCFRFWQLQRHRTIVLTPDKTKSFVVAPQKQVDTSSEQDQKIHFEFYTMLSKKQTASDHSTVVSKQDNIVSVPESVTENLPATSISTKMVTLEAPPPESEALIEKITAKSLVKEKYVVQIGVFSNVKAAESSKNQMSNLAVPIHVVKSQLNGKTIYRVEAGPFETIDVANQLQSKLAQSKVKSMVRQQVS